MPILLPPEIFFDGVIHDLSVVNPFAEVRKKRNSNDVARSPSKQTRHEIKVECTCVPWCGASVFHPHPSLFYLSIFSIVSSFSTSHLHFEFLVVSLSLTPLPPDICEQHLEKGFRVTPESATFVCPMFLLSSKIRLTFDLTHYIQLMYRKIQSTLSVVIDQISDM